MLQRFMIFALLIGMYDNACAMDNAKKSRAKASKEQATSSSSSSSSVPSSQSSKRKINDLSLSQQLNIEEQMQTEITSSSSSSQPKKKSSWDYNPIKTRNLYDADSCEPYKLSRSKLENDIRCHMCSFLDLKEGLTPPPGYPLSLNIAIDELQKKDSNICEKLQKQLPVFAENNIDAIPFSHKDKNKWQNSLSQGIRSKAIPGTNIFLQGGIDDIVINRKTGQLHVVDNKSTAKKGDVSLDADWQDGYKRQVEVYQYNFRDNDFDVSNTAYFPYANVKKDAEGFNNKLEFTTTLLTYEGNTAWIQPTVQGMYQRLRSNKLPSAPQATICAMCQYFNRRTEIVAKYNAQNNNA